MTGGSDAPGRLVRFRKAVQCVCLSAPAENAAVRQTGARSGTGATQPPFAFDDDLDELVSLLEQAPRALWSRAIRASRAHAVGVAGVRRRVDAQRSYTAVLTRSIRGAEARTDGNSPASNTRHQGRRSMGSGAVARARLP